MKAPRHRSSARHAPSGKPAGLPARLTEAEETLRAIRTGEVDAVVTAGREGLQVFTLDGAADAYRVLIESMNEGALTLTTDKLVLYANQCFARMVRRPLEQVIGASFREFLAVEDRKPLRAMLKHAGKAGSRVQLSLHAADGSTLPVLISVRPLAFADKAVLTVAMVVTDMTEAHRTEALLRELAHRSVQAQESERRRVAVELHDRITQMLCAVMVRSQTLADRVAPRDAVAKKEAGELRDLVGRAAEEVDRIARDLQPSALHYVGLPAVLRTGCAEFAQRTGLAVKVSCRPLAAKLSAEAALACYRILQEALKNIEEHARARTVRVGLGCLGAAVVLSVSDDGVGFVPGQRKAGVKTRHGFGLLSMAERAASVEGRLDVISAPGKGTTVRVSVRVPALAGPRRGPARGPRPPGPPPL